MKKLVQIIPLILIALVTVFPVLFLMTGAFMGTTEIKEYINPMIAMADGYVSWRLIPMYPTIKNLIELLLDSPEFFQMFWNSIKITVGILAGQLIFGMPSAWGLARYSFRGKKQIYLLYIVLMMMPFQVMMLSEYLVLDRLYLLDSLWAIILPGMFSTFSVFIMYRFFGSIPVAIVEAARIDGASEWAIFWQLGIPLGSAGIISALVLQFLECWSLIEQPITFLKTKSLWPLSLYLPEISLNEAGFALCASLLALLPAVLVFISGQDYLEQGIVAVAMKE